MQTRQFVNRILTVLAPFSPFAPLAQAIGKKSRLGCIVTVHIILYAEGVVFIGNSDKRICVMIATPVNQ